MEINAIARALRRRVWVQGLVLGAALAAASTANADAAPFSIETALSNGSKASLTVGGYVDAFYQWNFNNPSNGVTNYRAFDNRHNTFTISNAVLDLAGKVSFVSANVILQVGHTPESYYLAEPSSPASSGAGASGANVWKYLQAATLGMRFPIGRGLYLDGGLMVSPVGPETFHPKDQWTNSHSNLFFGNPFYHTGIKLSYPFTERLTVYFHVHNGWNSVVDNNSEKTMTFEVAYNHPDKLVVEAIYMTGVERPRGAPEGRAWRHLFDAYGTYYPTKWLALQVNLNGGVEPNHFGTSWWAAGSGALRVIPLSWLRLAARGDYFSEKVGSSSRGTASSIFWPVPWMASFNFCIELRPFDNALLRFEFRHDEAGGQAFFKGQVPSNLDGSVQMNARAQETLTAGLSTWF